MELEVAVAIAVAVATTLLLLLLLLLRRRRQQQQRRRRHHRATTALAIEGDDGELFGRVPCDVKVLIFSQLAPCDLASAARVCRAWRALAADDSVWQALFVARAGSLCLCCAPPNNWRRAFAAAATHAATVARAPPRQAPPGSADSVRPHRSSVSVSSSRPHLLQRIFGARETRRLRVCACGKGVRALFRALYSLDSGACPVVRSGVFPGAQDVGSAVGVWADASHDLLLCALQGARSLAASHVRHVAAADGVLLVLSAGPDPALLAAAARAARPGTPLAILIDAGSGADAATAVVKLNLDASTPAAALAATWPHGCVLVQPLDFATLAGLPAALAFLVSHRHKLI